MYYISEVAMTTHSYITCVSFAGYYKNNDLTVMPLTPRFSFWVATVLCKIFQRLWFVLLYWNNTFLVYSSVVPVKESSQMSRYQTTSKHNMCVMYSFLSVWTVFLCPCHEFDARDNLSDERYWWKHIGLSLHHVHSCVTRLHRPQFPFTCCISAM